MPRTNRRRFLVAAGGAASLAAGAGSPAEGLDTPPPTRPIDRTTFTYKQVGKLKIQADVIRPDDRNRRPVAVWIHGGALINGHREGIHRLVRDTMLKAGCVLVSIDYRLAPETRLPAILSDVEDAFAWIRKEGPRLFYADPNRIGVFGGSAGGYLTLSTGYRVRPRPTVLVSLWGYGDLIGDWYSKPSPHPRHHRVKLSRAEAYAQVSGPPVSDSRKRKGNGGHFYQYCRQHGIWPKAVSGWDPRTEAARFAPYMPVKNVDRQYPPTVLIHGDRDTDVPYEQSAMMAAEFRKHEVEHRLLRIAGGEHGLAGGKPAEIRAAYRKAFDFATRALKTG